MSGIFGYFWYPEYQVVPETSGLPEISGKTLCFGLTATRWFPKLNRVGSGIERNTGYWVGFGYPLGTDVDMGLFSFRNSLGKQCKQYKQWWHFIARLFLHLTMFFLRKFCYFQPKVRLTCFCNRYWSGKTAFTSWHFLVPEIWTLSLHWIRNYEITDQEDGLNHHDLKLFLLFEIYSGSTHCGQEEQLRQSKILKAWMGDHMSQFCIIAWKGDSGNKACQFLLIGCSDSKTFNGNPPSQSLNWDTERVH